MINKVKMQEKIWKDWNSKTFKTFPQIFYMWTLKTALTFIYSNSSSAIKSSRTKNGNNAAMKSQYIWYQTRVMQNVASYIHHIHYDIDLRPLTTDNQYNLSSQYKPSLVLSLIKIRKMIWPLLCSQGYINVCPKDLVLWPPKSIRFIFSLWLTRQQF